MFYPFNQHKQQNKQSASRPHSDRLAEGIASRWLKWQRRFSDAVNAQINRLSSGWQKSLFYSVIATAGLYSLYLIICGFSPGFSAQLFPSLSKPQLPMLQGRDKLLVNDQQLFQAYLDSLENAFILDSIQQSKTHPQP